MEIKNKSFAQSIFDQLSTTFLNIPNPDFTEIVSVDESLGCKSVNDIYANRNYPSVALSRLEGIMLYPKQNITTKEQFKQITPKSYGFLTLGENPFVLQKPVQFLSETPPFIPIGNFANTVISEEKYREWKQATYIPPDEEHHLTEIYVGEGMVKIGADYNKQDLILRKDEIITAAKKALLNQAGVSKLKVIKEIKIAVLLVEYELDQLNKSLEQQYIFDVMKLWGYNFEFIKIKPYKHDTRSKKTVDARIATDMQTFDEELQEVYQNYDYVLAFGLSSAEYFSNLGLRNQSYDKKNRITSYALTHLDSVRLKQSEIANYFRMNLSDIKSPTKTEQLTVFNDQGRPQYSTTISYENRAIISYIPGFILDIIVQMHLYIKPTIQARKYNRPFSPEWKIGELSHDYDFINEQDYQRKILWAFVEDVGFDNRTRRPVVSHMHSLKIIDIDNIRPDKIDFMRDCNCIIVTYHKDNQLKAGDYLYYLEI